jgi:virulence-associated protein VagC
MIYNYETVRVLNEMKLKVTKAGVLIPKEFLGELEEVELIQEQDKITIAVVKSSSSIWQLGRNPVECDVTDLGSNHDAYLSDR